MRDVTQLRANRSDSCRGAHLLLVLIVFSAVALAVTSGHGQSNQALAGFCAFVQMPLPFLSLIHI